VFRLHVELEDVTPPIWRKVLVPSNITLADLHTTLNEVMGWTNSHLHQFILRDRRFGDVTMPDSEELELEDERKVCLDALIGEKQRVGYEYDFGDGWLHRVEVEKKLELDARLLYPLCVGGARACPPEDCGGPGGYEHLLEVLKDEKDEEYDDLVTWVGGHFDPEGFDVNRTNSGLRERCR
jgi:Plasmid pRiA4b ORF-3-like protein